MLHDDVDVLVSEPSLSKPFNPLNYFCYLSNRSCTCSEAVTNLYLRKPKHIKLNLVSRSPAIVNMYYFTV